MGGFRNNTHAPRQSFEVNLVNHFKSYEWCYTDIYLIWSSKEQKS